MDLMTGLSAVSTAFGIVKDLRDVEKGYDEAAFKLKLAELTSALADAKMALSDANLRIAELEAKLTETNDGTVCPACKTGRLKMVSSRKHGFLNTEYHKFECTEPSCEYATTRNYDPTRAVYSKT